jgi:PTH1 family peptidyl-tRNA hydrolase
MFFRRKKKPPPEIIPEVIIVGLGNPGPKYVKTRHNVGFDVIDYLAQQVGARLETRDHWAVFTVATIEEVGAVLAKPMTFMNLSGQAVASLSRQFGIPPDDILVVADDVDLPVGKVRMKPKGGPGGHNGHRSIIDALGTQEYPRIRIGIGKGGGSTADHVLDRFTLDERIAIDEAIEIAAEGCRIWVRDGIADAATWVNTR